LLWKKCRISPYPHPLLSLLLSLFSLSHLIASRRPFAKSEIVQLFRLSCLAVLTHSSFASFSTLANIFLEDEIWMDPTRNQTIVPFSSPVSLYPSFPSKRTETSARRSR
jgi:hypothetical protein